MANFVVIVDADQERRTRYLEQVRDRVAPVDNLSNSGITNGGFGAVWAAHPAAPIRTSDADDHAAAIFGEAIEVGSANRVTAFDLAQRWDPAVGGIPDPYDGYYAAISCHHGKDLTAGTDLLGLFPLYYAATKQVVIVSSTPELIPLHPLFPLRMSMEGLVGILLTDALMDNRPLLDGIRRLPAGHAVVWQKDVGAREVVQYTPPVSERRSMLSFGEQIDQLDHVLELAVQRHTPTTEPHGILLSGGRDSRMLAGYLAQLGRTPRALTMGTSGDYEVICATRVSRALQLEHHIASPSPADYPRTAVLHATWDHLSSGFSSVHLWGIIEHLRALAPTFTNGYLADAIVGGAGLKLRARPERVAPWETIFSKLNARGIEAATLKRLLHRPGGTAVVDEVVDRIRMTFDSSCPVEAERLWRFQLANTARHRVGSTPWRMSFGSWPVLPILDRRLLDTIADLPVETLATRRAQDEIIRRRFPRLARIPMVAENAEMARPLVPSITHRVGDRVRAALRQFKLPRTGRAHLPDRRYIWRMYDFNGPGWQAIRARAEPNRHLLAGLFDPEQLAAYLPAPGERFPSRSFYDSMGRKQLVGLMLWAERHLA